MAAPITDSSIGCGVAAPDDAGAEATVVLGPGSRLAGIEPAPSGGWVGQFVPVWTGPELVVLAKHFGSRGSTALRAYPYDTTADQWRPVPNRPEAPADGPAYWTGSQVVAWTERGRLTSR